MSRRPPGGRSRPAASGPTGARGQIHVDFVVGIALFLVGLTFVVGVVPQLLVPYDDQATPVVADRAAATLGDDLLTGDRGTGVLDAACVDAFFRDGTADCGFDPSASVPRRVGVDESYRVNVRLTANVTGDAARETLCFNGGDVGACGTGPLAVGPPIPDARRAVTTAQRTVVVDGDPVTLEVRVW